MQSAFPIVVFGAVALSLVMSVVFLLTGGRSGEGGVYEEIGRGGFSQEAGSPGWGGERPPPAADSAAARAEREREVRQMLGARNERLVRSGKPPLDIDAEVARLLAAPAAADEQGLGQEVRQLVLARNERRLRQGLEPLDVDAEVARTLKEFNP
jgi:hypothetical protein